MEQAAGGMARDGRIFHTLDALRGVAAFAVVCFHRRVGWFPSAYLAVDLFYVLSGFVLAYAYDDQFENGLSARRFMVQRVIRLWPLYAIGVLIAFVAAVLAGDPNAWAEAPLQLLFLPASPGPGHAPLYPLNLPAWSLMFELGVNAVWAIFWRSLRGPMLVVAICAAGGALLGTILYNGSGDVGTFWSTLAGGVPRALFGFLLGIGLFRWRRRKTPVVHALGWGAPCLLLGGCLLAFPVGSPRAAFDAGFDFALSPAIVLAGSILEPPTFAVPITKWLGLLSYPVYAVHWPLMQLFDQLVSVHTGPPMLKHVAFLIAATGFGAVLAVRYDPWARRALSACVIGGTR